MFLSAARRTLSKPPSWWTASGSILPLRHRHFIFLVPGHRLQNRKRDLPAHRTARNLQQRHAENWYYPDADNTLRATLSVSQVPSSGKIVIGQIHAYKSQKPLVKVEYQYKTSTSTGNIVAKVRMHPDDDTARVITIATGVKLNQEFSYLIHLSPGGALGISAAGYQWDTDISTMWRDKPLYFKAGVYVQDNTGYTTEGGK